MNKYKRIPVVRLTMTVVFAAIILAAGAAFGQTGPPPPLKAQIVFGDLVYNLDEDAIAVDIKLQNITSPPTSPPTPIWTIKDFDSFHAYLFFYGPIGDDARLITSATGAPGGGSPSPTPSVEPDDVAVEWLDENWTNGAIKLTIDEVRDIYSLTRPGQYKVWFAMSFVQYDADRVFSEDRNGDGTPEDYAPYDAAVYRGVIEYKEAYITLTNNVPPAVTSDVRVSVTEYIFGEGSRPGVTKVPFEDNDFILRLYSRSACEAKYSPVNHTTCPAIANDPLLNAQAMVAASVAGQPGEYIFEGVEQDDCVIIGYAGPGTDYKHLWKLIDAADTRWGGEMSIKLKLMTDYRGKKMAAKSKKITGSELLIIEPEYVEWTSDQELYPFAFESLGDWGVEVAVEPPEGFVADSDSLSESVSSDLKAVQFTITDVGSKYESTEVKYKLKHKKKTTNLKSKVYIKLSRKLAKEKKVPIWGEDEEKIKSPKTK